MSKLYTPFQIGAVRLDHRIVQAPLTRLRSDQPGDVPSAMMVKYYGQRASKGGLQIAEATPVSIQGRGYLGAPGIYDDAQVEGWRKVTDAVHAKGGAIFDQLRKRVPRIDHVLAEQMPDGRLLLEIKDAPFDQPILARFASDGTLKMLAYLVVLYDPDPPQFIGVEEPENFLHPRLLPGLAEECRAATSRSQVLVTTHSPFFLDALRHKPHPTHSTVQQSLRTVQMLGPRRAYFTHISHDLPHHATEQMLPNHVRLAYDGLRISVREAI